MKKPIKTAVFPVGGLGTRNLPATKAIPKEMLAVANKPIIQYAFEEAVEAGIERFIFITGRNKIAITEHFDTAYELENSLSESEKMEALALTKGWLPKPGKIAFIRQQKPLGLGHAVLCAKDFVGDEPFAVLLADEMFLTSPKHGVLTQMIEKYNAYGHNVIAVDEVMPEEVERYGIVTPKASNEQVIEMAGVVEKPKQAEAPSNIAIVGRYIFQPEIFNSLENNNKLNRGEIQLTDSIQDMLAKGYTYYGHKIEGQRVDCGNTIGFLEANIRFTLNDPNFQQETIALIKKIAGGI